MAIRAGLFAVLLLLLGACTSEPSADSADAVVPTTEAPTTTTDAAPTTTGAGDPEPADDTGSDPGACPDAAPVPAGVATINQAPLDYDGDGDGDGDVLSLYEHDGGWWLHVAWASGGSAAVAIDDAGAMGARALGGHDLTGDGLDEAWVAIAGPAAGVLVGVYRTVGCDLEPVIDDSGTPFVFPVTETVGTFSGARCDGVGDIDLFSGEMVGPDAAEYLVSQQPVTVADGQAIGGPGDAGSITPEEVYRYSWLECGGLGGVL